MGERNCCIPVSVQPAVTCRARSGYADLDRSRNGWVVDCRQIAVDRRLQVLVAADIFRARDTSVNSDGDAFGQNDEVDSAMTYQIASDGGCDLTRVVNQRDRFVIATYCRVDAVDR